MKLLLDDYNGVYVWVDDHDENIEYSPHFDYEEDAIQWYKNVRDHMLDKLGLEIVKKDQK